MGRKPKQHNYTHRCDARDMVRTLEGGVRLLTCEGPKDRILDGDLEEPMRVL
jgi:hypothetical protein